MKLCLGFVQHVSHKQGVCCNTAGHALATDEKPASGLAKRAERLKERKTLLVGVRTLLASPSFQAITFASALNDVGSWALVSWHATFYTKVFGIGPDIYAPMLAAIIPIGGIIGGVGSGLMGDWLSRTGNRHWLTSGLHSPPFMHLTTLGCLYSMRATDLESCCSSAGCSLLLWCSCSGTCWSCCFCECHNMSQCACIWSGP